MSHKLTRRTVLGAAAATTAGWTIVPRHVLGRGYKAPSDTLNIAGIGAGGKGATDIAGCSHENIAALCDIDFKRGSRSVQNHPDAPRYKDYRILLDQEPNIDAVIVSTPDHMHAFVALEAMRRGKHVYCQKPLTRTLEECWALMQVAEEQEVVTQMGNQGSAADGTRVLREWIESGIIGDVEAVDLWTNRPIWPQALNRPTDMHNVPPNVDWDLWLGCAPDRPYHPDYYHPFNWRGWWDFGTGALGDIACHSMQAPFWIFDLKNPDRIEAETTRLYEESAPAASRITYHFPANDRRGPMTMIWRDGQLAPPRPAHFDGPRWPPMDSGQIYLGKKGTLIADIYGNRPRLYPQALQDKVDASPVPEKIPRTEGIYKEWTEACKGNGATGSGIPDQSGPLTEVALLGNLAVRTREIIHWDPKRRTSGSSTADELLRGDYRDGWSLGVTL